MRWTLAALEMYQNVSPLARKMGGLGKSCLEFVYEVPLQTPSNNNYVVIG